MRGLRTSMAVACAALAGCGTAELELVFEIPPIYDEAVAQVVLEVYQPRGEEAFDCEALAFGRVDDGVLRASRVEQSVVRPDENSVPLADIARATTKIFLAAGLDVDGEPVVRGCAEVGTIDADVAVRILAEPVASIVLVDSPNLGRTLGMPLEGPITLRVRDVAQMPLPGVEVFWEIDGAAGIASMDRALTDGAGEVNIRPALPDRPGPYVLDVEVRWASPGPPLANGFVAPEPEVLTFPVRVREYRSGHVGPAGELGFAALLDGEGGAGQVQVQFVYRGPGGTLVQTSSPDIPGVLVKMGMFDFRDDARDRIIVVTERSWIEVAPDGILIPRNYQPPVAAIGAAPRVVLPTGPCQANPDSPQVLITYDANAVGFFDLEANLAGGFSQRLDVVASGCVGDQSGAALRTLVIDGGAQVGLAVAVEVAPNVYVTQPWVAVGSGTAFSRAIGDSGPLLLGTQLSVNDFVVSRANWLREGDSARLVMQGLDNPPQAPLVNRGGDVDGDGQLDIVSLFGQQAVPGGPIRWSLWTVLGRAHDGLRLSGSFDLGDAPRLNPTLIVSDLDGDGVDDIAIAEQADAFTPPRTPTRIEIYRMGVPAD